MFDTLAKCLAITGCRGNTENPIAGVLRGLMLAGGGASGGGGAGF